MGKDPIKLTPFFLWPHPLAEWQLCGYAKKNVFNGGTIMAGNQDLKSAEQTYSGFLGLMKWGTVVSIAVTVLVVVLIAG